MRAGFFEYITRPTDAAKQQVAMAHPLGYAELMEKPSISSERRQRWQELTLLLDRVDRKGVRHLKTSEVKQLCRLYRQVTIDLSLSRSRGGDPDLVRYLNILAGRAHGRVYRTKKVDFWPIFTFAFTGFPRLARRCWRPILAASAVFLLTAVASWLAVVRDPQVAYSLFDENVVEVENIRLEKQEGEYRGNFTFSLSMSPLVAAQIIGNNVRVAILGFALGSLCCVPGVLLLTYNGRMLGTLAGLVWNGGYFLGFHSLILTHGILELSAICIASAGGLHLGWALIAPGNWTRQDALKRAGGDAFGLLMGAVLMLILAGIIEAYVTPHCNATVRWSVAGSSAVGMLLYFGLAGRSSGKAAQIKPRLTISTN